jgi:hypothetical protein
MTAKEVLYDSETLLRLVDSEIEELRLEPELIEVIPISPVKPEPALRGGQQGAESDALLHGIRQYP